MLSNVWVVAAGASAYQVKLSTADAAGRVSVRQGVLRLAKDTERYGELMQVQAARRLREQAWPQRGKCTCGRYVGVSSKPGWKGGTAEACAVK